MHPGTNLQRFDDRQRQIQHFWPLLKSRHILARKLDSNSMMVLFCPILDSVISTKMNILTNEQRRQSRTIG